MVTFVGKLIFVYLVCPQIKIYCFKTNTQGPRTVFEFVKLYVRQNILYVRNTLYLPLKMELNFN
jgi:hypothetical protein